MANFVHTKWIHWNIPILTGWRPCGSCVLRLLLHVLFFLVHIYCIFLLNVGRLCAWNPVYCCYYYLQLHIHSQILRAGSVNRGEWSGFYLQNKAFIRIIAHMLQLYPFSYLLFKESFLNSKGKYSKNTSPFSSSYSTKLGRGQVSCILQQTWDFKFHFLLLLLFL